MKKNILYLGLFFTTLGFCQNTNTFNSKEAELYNSASFVVYDDFTSQDDTFIQEYYKALSLFKNKKYQEALKLVLNITDEIKDPKLLGKCNFLIGSILKENKNYKRAILYFKTSDSLFDVLNNKVLLAKNAQLLASSYLNFYIKDTLAPLSLLDDSKRYFNSALYNFGNSDEFSKEKAMIYSDLSTLFSLKKDNKKTKKYADIAIASFKKLKDTMAITIALNNLANNYWDKKEFINAKKYYLEAINLIDSQKDLKAIQFKESFLENLAYTMYNLKEYEAFKYLNKSFKIRDSLRNVEIRTILAKIDAEFNAERIKKQEEIKRLSEIRDKERSQRLNTILMTGFLLSILGAFTLFRYMRIRREKVELELSQTQLIQQKKIATLRQEAQTKIINATLDGKEQERKEIAEILHDSVSALLSSANLHLQASKSQIAAPIPVEILKTQSILSEASNKIRNLSHDILSSVLLKFGLGYAVQDLCEKHSNSKIKFEDQGEGIQRYNQKFEIKINSIIEELLNNIIKHSKASKATIHLKEKDAKIEISIRDNGVGFEVSKIQESETLGIGLSQIEARIKIMKGVFKIDSFPNKGTKVYIKVPIKYKKKD